MALLKATVENGTLIGLPGGNQGVSYFKGIPFAKPPVGDLRWRAPQPAEDWKDEKQAYAYGPIPMQWRVPESSIYKKEFYPIDLERSEDCLYLNVITPAKSIDEKLPVALWIYGGGYNQGYANKMETDGESFAKRGVVYVSCNYRVGPFGFMAHPELSAESESEIGVKTSGNYGILDQIAALKWVRRNIAAFGGDPEKITIFGQSAGAMSVQTLVSSKLTEGDIDKAIMQSAGGLGVMQLLNNLSLEAAEKRGIRLLDHMNLKNIKEARSMSAEELLDLYTKFSTQMLTELYFTPVVDGYVLEKDWVTLAREGKTHDIQYMLGCTKDDLAFSGVPKDATLESVRAKAQAIFGDYADKFLEASNGGDLEAHKAIMNVKNDMYEGCANWCENQLKLKRKPSYDYLFSQPIPESNMGTFHSSEHMYVFQTFLRGWRPYTGADFDLSNIMCGYWTNFIKTGNPNGEGLPEWTPYSESSREYMELKTGGGMKEYTETSVSKFEKDFILGNL